MADPYNWERHGSETIGPFNPVAREEKCKRRVSQDKWKKSSGSLLHLQLETRNSHFRSPPLPWEQEAGKKRGPQAESNSRLSSLASRLLHGERSPGAGHR